MRLRDKIALRLINSSRKITANGKTQSRTFTGNTDSGSKFTGGTDDLLGQLDYDHTTLRGKSRKAVFDAPPVASIQNRKVQSVVDTGINIDPTPDYAEIGLTEQQAEQFAKYARRFNDWMGWKSQHRREQMTFYQAQNLAQTEKIRDGEYFFRAYYNYTDNLPHPLQWEALDADQIKDYTATLSQDGYSFIDTKTKTDQPADGIFKDERGRAKAYLIHINKNGAETAVKVMAKTPSGRYQIIHGFMPEYSFQTRGFPANSKILQDSTLLQSFSLANIQKAINQAQRVYAISNKDQDPTSPFNEGDLTSLMDGLGDYFNTNPETRESTPNEEAIAYLNSPIFKTISLQTQPGSESLIMPEKGTEIKELQNTAPVQGYDVFVGSFFSFLAAAENVPVEVALMKFSSNYSASRAALIMFWRICEVERADLDTDLLSPFYEMFIAEGIASGEVSAPGWSDPRLRILYLRHRIIGAPMMSIDPARESVATLNQLGVGGTAFTRGSENLNGSDFEKNLKENLKYSEDIDKLRQNLGLNQRSFNNG